MELGRAAGTCFRTCGLAEYPYCLRCSLAKLDGGRWRDRAHTRVDETLTAPRRGYLRGTRTSTARTSERPCHVGSSPRGPGLAHGWRQPVAALLYATEVLDTSTGMRPDVCRECYRAGFHFRRACRMHSAIMNGWLTPGEAAAGERAAGLQYFRGRGTALVLERMNQHVLTLPRLETELARSCFRCRAIDIMMDRPSVRSQRPPGGDSGTRQ